MGHSIKLFNYRSSIVETYALGLGESAFYSTPRVDPDTTRENEDSAAVVKTDRGDFLILADGMGGHKHGNIASQIAVETIAKACEASSHPTMIGALCEAIDEAHRLIKELKSGSGTTLVIAEIAKNYVRFYNIGDSCGFLISGRGLLKYKSVEHSPTGYAMESGYMSEEKALNHSDSNLISNALGLDHYHIEISAPIIKNPNDVILVASDGLTANISNQLIYEYATKGSVEEKLQRIVDSAKEQMYAKEAKFQTPDDLTALLYR
jgi:serine/threonine protein phosphatase PrpC